MGLASTSWNSVRIFSKLSTVAIAIPELLHPEAIPFKLTRPQGAATLRSTPEDDSYSGIAIFRVLHPRTRTWRGERLSRNVPGGPRGFQLSLDGKYGGRKLQSGIHGRSGRLDRCLQRVCNWLWPLSP